MRILLASFCTMDYVTRIDRSPPLSLLCLAAVLREAGYEPKILDLDLAPVPTGSSREEAQLQHLLDATRKVRPIMIGLNCLLSAHFPLVRKAAAAIKEEFPSLPVVIGGIHPTLFAEDILQHCPSIDVIVMGEGERQATALAEAYARGAVDSLHRIESVAFRDASGEIVITPRRQYIKDLDSLPLPAWDLIRIEDYYTDHSSWHNPRGLEIKMSVPVLSSRSCPYDCNFCSSHNLMGRGLRLRSPKRVVDEMQMLYDNYGLSYFGFVDDNLTLNKQHILEICNEIIKRRMVIQFESFNGYNLKSLDEEIVDAMVRAGCVYVILPIEHGNDRMRNEIIGKRLDREKIFEVAGLYKRHGLLTRAVFIMGFPEDTRETLTDTYNMILDLQMDMNTVFNLIPFPGTKIFEQAARDRLFVGEVEVDRLWEGLWDLNAVRDSFYLRPYRMSLDELAEFREKFDALRFFSERANALQRKKGCDDKQP